MSGTYGVLLVLVANISLASEEIETNPLAFYRDVSGSDEKIL
jgi:hypothetical protein